MCIRDRADIVANDYDLSINRYKETIYEEVHYEKPTSLIAEIKSIDAKRQAAIIAVSYTHLDVYKRQIFFF